ncbi:hypothetical protein HNP65_001304 [Thermosipho japonicus]|uniref:Lipoprotein n=1 Tax=Thermosipho japonicus TaxID=90323 RepID=A0A841GGX0_9BACT|nr:hypothetical protein [Thermosipho japonicus]MBB6062852.1 hypothetical protein [Thermosipho japonicus]
MKRITLKIFWIISVFFLLMSCAISNSNDKFNINIKAPDVAEASKEVDLIVDGDIIGAKNVVVEISNEYNEKNILQLKKIPDSTKVIFEKPGKYSVMAKALSLIDGKEYVDYKPKIFVYDPEKPLVDGITIVPGTIFTDDDVILHLYANTSNPEVKVETVGLSRYGKEEISMTTKPGDIFLNVGSFSDDGDKEFFVKVDNLVGMEYATKVNLKVYPIDKEPPTIIINSKFSYPTNSNIQVYVDISDDVKLSSYEIYLDGELKLEDTVDQEEMKNIPVQIGKLSPGDHSLIVKATDWLGKKTMTGKRILVGDTYLNFEIAISNETNLIPGHSTIISVVPTEEGINFKKIVYFIDGKEYKRFDGDVQTFVEWTVEEGEHYITVYAEDENGRAGINERFISVNDNSAPRLISMSVNGEKLDISKTNNIPLGMNSISACFMDPGGISKYATPILYIREDHYSDYYDILEMKLSEISPDEKEATFTINTSIGYGYFYFFVKGVSDKEGNEYQGEDVFTVITGY